MSEAAQAEAIETLARAGYLDDLRFACDRATRMAERGYGDERIRADLDSQGAPPQATEQALAALEPEVERALRAAQRLGGGTRAAATLARRGFSEETVETVLARNVADDP